MAYINELVKDCLQFERAFCTAKCPFSLDIIDFIGKLQQSRFNVAYRTYLNAVGFPGIVSALCSEPCKLVCPMEDAGGAISLKLLEMATIDFARSTEPDQFNMPYKDKRIAVVGAGISGLACALRLAAKKYDVTIYERSNRVGGHLHGLLPSKVIFDDIERQFMYEKYTLYLNTEISSLKELNFDAIYVATGHGGSNFDYAESNDGVFIGGSLTGADTMHAIAQGLNISSSIESYLKTGQMAQPDVANRDTKLPPEAIRVIPSDAILPNNGTAYTKEEALAEARRCLKCTCDACVHYSPLMSYFQKFPKRITEEVEVTVTPCTLDGNGTVATRLIATCNHCGLCKEVCPQNIDTGEFLLQSHRAMHKKGAMPWAFHEFYLRDMEFSNGEAAFVRLPIGFTKSRYVFFPGCQLGASDPRYVVGSYGLLADHFPDTALMMYCCGAPADWAGDEVVHESVLEKIKAHWTSLGKPTVIFACPTCKQMFQKYLPEIEGEFLYSMIAREGLLPNIDFKGEVASVFDPCSSRYESEVQHTIRDIAKKAGFNLEPLPMEGKFAECCSYGGQVAVAYPPYVSHIAKARVEQNDRPYIAYCANCRDIFTAAGKKTWHILDLILGIDNSGRTLPNVSERRNNRLQLKYQVANEFWKEKIIVEKPYAKLLISPELKEKLNKELILDADIYTVIKTCEQSGRKLYDSESDSFTAYSQIGNMTYWVEYRNKPEFGFEIVNAYGHRMKVEEE